MDCTVFRKERCLIGILTTLAITAALYSSAPPPIPTQLADDHAHQVAPNASVWRRQAVVRQEALAENERKIDEIESEVSRLQAEIKRLKTPRASIKSANSKTYEATFYTAFCPTGCIGITATGIDVSRTIYSPEGYRIIAVDPSVIKLGTVVRVKLADGTSFKALAADTGGDIKGNRIDILVASRAEAYRLGRQNVEITY